jgi:hypothetical protein
VACFYSSENAFLPDLVSFTDVNGGWSAALPFQPDEAASGYDVLIDTIERRVYEKEKIY